MTEEMKLENKVEELNTNKQKEKKKKRWLLLLLLLLSILVGCFLWFRMHSSQFDDNAQAYDDPIRIGKNWKTGDLVIPGFGEVPVNHKDKNIKITLGNSKVNKAYFKYKVTVKENGRVITLLDSKLVKPGNAITQVPTDKLSMKPGKYPMTITTSTFSLKDEKAPMNGTSVDATLVVK
jgi:flagellar basal body-associated protein FliL